MSLPATIEALYVVDTHALIWYLTNNKKLGNRASTVFAVAERGETRLLISTISLAELYYANKKHVWFADFEATYRQLRAKPYFRIVDFKPDQVMDFDSDAAIPEMHDRIIVGLARRTGAPLLTDDSQIIASGIVSVIW
jgi:PIN domain nuclease of toxin-antitoxin system